MDGPKPSLVKNVAAQTMDFIAVIDERVPPNIFVEKGKELLLQFDVLVFDSTGSLVVASTNAQPPFLLQYIAAELLEFPY